MERLVSRWKLILLVTTVAGAAIFAFYPDYNTLQMSKDANDFTQVLGGDSGRATVANLSDMVFALAYGALGVVAFNGLASGTVALNGSMLAVGAALADEIENVLVLLNIHTDSLTNGKVGAMTTVGLVKWMLVGAAIMMLIVVAVRARRSKASNS